MGRLPLAWAGGSPFPPDKMRYLSWLWLLALTGWACHSTPAPALPDLRVSADGRHLETVEGDPFFYLGDTAWELFHRLNREEAEAYLQDRAAKGFTVIQAVALAELDGLQDPNPYGDRPLEAQDPTRPVEAYFAHVDWIIDRAGQLGLYIGLLPTWGDKWNKQWGVGPEIFTPENARAYGAWLGARYRDRSNLIWILGGDRKPDSPLHLAIIDSMAAGLAAGDGGRHLMTFHPMGGYRSAEFFHDRAWLDFNMSQSGHGTDYATSNYVLQRRSYAEQPVKPTLDGEPCYEDHPIAWKPAELGWYDDSDVRRTAWWGLLSGGCGTTYGNHNIWQMWQPGRAPISWARTRWREALAYPGAAQVGYLRRFWEARPWTRLQPDTSLLAAPNPPGAAHILAARDREGTYLIAYSPQGAPFALPAGVLGTGQLRAWWLNPRDGQAWEAGTFDGAAPLRLEPPAPGPGSDWGLLVEQVAAGYSPLAF